MVHLCQGGVLARISDPKLKEELLKKSVDACIQDGFSGFSLRTLADQIGTSHRMLIYHFGSAQKLFETILGEFRKRNVAIIQEEFSQAKSAEDFARITQRLWKRLSSEENRNFMISYFEVQNYCLNNDDTRKASENLNPTPEHCLEPIEKTLTRLGVTPAQSRTTGRLILSGGRGLLLDGMGCGTTTDQKEVQRSFDLLVELAIQVIPKKR